MQVYRCSWGLCLVISCYERNFRLHVHFRLNFHHFAVLQGWRSSLRSSVSPSRSRPTSTPVHMVKDHFKRVIQRPEKGKTAQKKQGLQITKQQVSVISCPFHIESKHAPGVNYQWCLRHERFKCTDIQTVSVEPFQTSTLLCSRWSHWNGWFHNVSIVQCFCYFKTKAPFLIYSRFLITA